MEEKYWFIIEWVGSVPKIVMHPNTDEEKVREQYEKMNANGKEANLCCTILLD